MKITVTKIIRELLKNKGGHYIDETKELMIKDVLDIVSNELLKHKKISFKK